MKANFLLRLLHCVRRPLVVHVGHCQTPFKDEIFSRRVDNNIWNADPRGGDAWCVQSFCLYHPNWLADFRNSSCILYCSDLLISKNELILEGIKFRNLYRNITFAEGNSFDWGLYFAKYFGCSLIINVKNPQRTFSSMIRPEDSLDQILYNWQFKSASESIVLKKLKPDLLYMSE